MTVSVSILVLPESHEETRVLVLNGRLTATVNFDLNHWVGR